MKTTIPNLKVCLSQNFTEIHPHDLYDKEKVRHLDRQTNKQAQKHNLE